jgi:hypothetical protein
MTSLRGTCKHVEQDGWVRVGVELHEQRARHASEATHVTCTRWAAQLLYVVIYAMDLLYDGSRDHCERGSMQ